jgi:hypothetical protein
MHFLHGRKESGSLQVCAGRREERINSTYSMVLGL